VTFESRPHTLTTIEVKSARNGHTLSRIETAEHFRLIINVRALLHHSDLVGLLPSSVVKGPFPVVHQKGIWLAAASVPLIRPTPADLRPRPLPCVHRLVDGDPEHAINPASLVSPLSEPVVASTEAFVVPTSHPGRHPPSPTVPTAAYAFPPPSSNHSLLLSLSPSSTTRITMLLFQIKRTHEALRMIWHQRLGHMHSRRCFVTAWHGFALIGPIKNR
jgi:hypothetical protein